MEPTARANNALSLVALSGAVGAIAGGLLLTSSLDDDVLVRVQKHVVVLLACALVALVMRPVPRAVSWQFFAVEIAAVLRLLQLTAYVDEWWATRALFHRDALSGCVLVGAGILQALFIAAAAPPLFTAARTPSPRD